MFDHYEDATDCASEDMPGLGPCVKSLVQKPLTQCACSVCRRRDCLDKGEERRRTRPRAHANYFLICLVSTALHCEQVFTLAV